MDKSAADAYVYAKVSSRIAKAFSGKNTEKLYTVKSLSDLYSLLFTGEVPAIPETLLSREIEKKAENQFLNEYISLLKCYSKPQELFVNLLQSYDFENLKTLAGALCLKETQMPPVLNLRQYSILNYKGWPEISKITADSILSWYNTVPDISKQQELDSKLDFQYLTRLWDSAKKMPLNCRNECENIFASEIQFHNILWALRLKCYYKMDKDEIVEKLFFDDASKGERDLLAGNAVKILDWDTSDYSQWKKWEYKSLLNPYVEGTLWEVDPRWIENCVHSIQLKKYSKAFHKFPLSSLSLVCYFKIKQNELDNIRRVTEGLHLGE